MQSVRGSRFHCSRRGGELRLARGVFANDLTLYLSRSVVYDHIDPRPRANA